VASSSGAIPDEGPGALFEAEGFDELPLPAPLGREINEVRAVATPDDAIALRVWTRTREIG
jgi:hypothetical protein